MKTINYLQRLIVKAALVLFLFSFWGCEEAGVAVSNVTEEETTIEGTTNEELDLLRGEACHR